MNLSDFASYEEIEARALSAWRPPLKLSLSEWADTHFRLSAESAADAGPWHTLAYQKGIMDAITDPLIEKVSVKKSARVGYTKILNATIGYYIHQAPCPMMLVQPTVDDAKGYSKEEIAPMLRDVPVLQKIVFEDSEETGPRDSGNTIRHKRFPGGVLSLVGANSGAGFRRVSRKVVLFDEPDAYPPSAGQDGDPIKLGTKRAEYYHDRKIVAGSTPLIEGLSRIDKLYHEGDERRFYVPCPQCGHKDFLVFQQNTSTGEGHFMQWPEDKPREAYFVCSKNGCTIEHKGKRALINAGEWRASKPFTGHASFHIWTAYSFAPNATWGHIAEEFLTAKRDGREALRAFINTTLGETWRESGEAPDWERLYHQREKYPIGIVPPGVKFLTCGVDVQKDRFVFEIVGWGVNRESWSINQGVIPGDTSDEKTWTLLDDLLTTPIPDYTGGMRQLLMMAVDSGYNTQEVYNFARTHERSAVMAVKGDASARAMVKPPTPVDVTVRGVRFARGAKVFPVGVDITKAELYGFLRLRVPIAAPSEPLVYPPGFCHFPEYDEAFFKQLTSEHLVTVTKRTGHMIHEWQLLPGRENHFLDCRVYARAAAHVKGVDRMITRLPPPVGLPPVAPLNPAPPQAKPVAPPRERRERSTFFGGRGKGWLGR